MSEKTKSVNVSTWPSGIGIGVWWYVWGVKGFWWGVLYGACWPVWIGYRLAVWLLAV